MNPQIKLILKSGEVVFTRRHTFAQAVSAVDAEQTLLVGGVDDVIDPVFAEVAGPERAIAHDEIAEVRTVEEAAA